MMKKLSWKTMMIILLVTYIMLSMTIMYNLISCQKAYNSTYVFRDQRGRFEAIVDFSPELDGNLQSDGGDSINNARAAGILTAGKENADSKDGVDNDSVSDKVTANETNDTKRCKCDNYGLPQDAQESYPPNPCASIPPNLVGSLNIRSNPTVEDMYNKTSLALLKPGGFYKPANCRAQERVAIIIPYRDRAHHLKILLYHLHTFLQRQELEYRVFVVEMAYPTEFNRGLLANAGFLNAREMMDFSCYIIHDVDQLPANDRNLYRCSENPRHLAVGSSKYGYTLPYGHYIGGTIALTPDQFIDINGFSNSYFGWGKEDDDFYKRIMTKFNINRPPPDHGIYLELPHERDTSNAANPMREGLFVTGPKRFHLDGVNSVLYNRLAMEYRPIYTWIYVNTSEALIMQRLQHVYARIGKDIRDKAGQ